ncbi:isopenicillin N synthase family dioxygenase [Tropicimonas marinistellae]|uniref:isopenicillin N synthase family dioxygenase n=1 Tax=Tropicimonas marinistellae TaxID=1739787 RepID=UPI0008361DCE|nr:2-oxoglutarate and iron-dependent oxygenase domain-containing protein [Tropicimonas marinistellae]
MIPILDWSRFSRGSDRVGFVREFGAACRESGFFLLSGHGIDQPLIQSVFEQADRFFELTEAEKRTLSVPSIAQERGWSKIGTESLEEGSDRPDRKEAFGIGPEAPGDTPAVRWGAPYRGANLWPDIPGFRETMLRFFSAAQVLAMSLHRAVAADLDLPEGWYDNRVKDPDARLRLLHYPPASGARGEMGAGTHTDPGVLTLLLTDGEPGLQVRPTPDGPWIDVPHNPGSFVVNVGDSLMEWSGGRYISSPHRVVPPQHVRRSVAFFLRPEPTRSRGSAVETRSGQAWADSALQSYARA